MDQELDYRGSSPPQTAVEREFYQCVSCEPSSGSGPVLEFTISGQSANEYLDLSQTYLSLEVEVKAKDGVTKLDWTVGKADKLAFTNNLLHSLFGTVELIANQVHLTRGWSNYAYLAYFQNLLGYNGDSKTTQLELEGFSKDEADKFEDEEGGGFKIRQGWLQGGKMQLMGAIKTDLGLQKKLIPDNVSLVLRLVRSPDSFALLDLAPVEGRGEYALSVTNPRLYVKKKSLSDAAHLALIKSIRQKPFAIPVRRQDVTTHSIASGTEYRKIERLIDTANLPRLVLVGFVKSSAYNGAVSLNPFRFDHFDLQTVQLFCNGLGIPNEPYHVTDWTKNQHAREYLHLYQAVGSWRQGTARGRAGEARLPPSGEGALLRSFRPQYTVPDSRWPITRAATRSSPSTYYPIEERPAET